MCAWTRTIQNDKRNLRNTLKTWYKHREKRQLQTRISKQQQIDLNPRGTILGEHRLSYGWNSRIWIAIVVNILRAVLWCWQCWPISSEHFYSIPSLQTKNVNPRNTLDWMDLDLHLLETTAKCFDRIKNSVKIDSLSDRPAQAECRKSNRIGYTIESFRTPVMDASHAKNSLEKISRKKVIQKSFSVRANAIWFKRKTMLDVSKLPQGPGIFDSCLLTCLLVYSTIYQTTFPCSMQIEWEIVKATWWAFQNRLWKARDGYFSRKQHR